MDFIYTSPLLIPSRIEINHFHADENNPNSYNHITANMRLEENNRQQQIRFITIASEKLIYIGRNIHFEFQVRDAVEKFGNPDFVWIENPAVDLDECYISMLWKEEQIIFSTELFDHKEFDKYCWGFIDYGLVPATAKLQYISITSSADIASYNSEEGMHPWVGFYEED